MKSPKTLPKPVMKLQNKDKVLPVSLQTSETTVKNSILLQSKSTKHSSVVVSSSIRSKTNMSQDLNDFSLLQPISDDPNHIMEEITSISANLIDIASESFIVFNRSLEHFAQLSEKMLQLAQTQNTSYLVSTMIAIGKLREKIGDFRNLLTQINSNPSCDYTSQLEVSVNGISKSCGDLYNKLYSNK